MKKIAITAFVVACRALCGTALAQNFWPNSTLQLTSATTAYSTGQLIASSATAANVAVPSFSMAPASASPVISLLHLYSNDPTSTGWFGQTIQVDLWSSAPTFTNGDRGTFELASGSANHLASFSCVMSAYPGATTDGAYAECALKTGNYFAPPAPATGKLGFSTIYWTLEAVTGSGATGASKTFMVEAEVLS